ncbi:hypothetical protein SR42_11290 [Clostridium botulinum]|uniref:NUDIX domain-containing protein n=1 Tax=Clostridium botulinum TaxID=1491 RepID=UPI0005975D92|nr:NUDIX domain-containing protein [Clostridium botulinum]KIL09537.1 hypothetical protein SR42_11290 [Clostridium botulinum]MBY6933245.1 NUDIX domain-containing protein [Clostridium botulinum]NFE72487.1 NUDIX domain-containing protein [Clostridium botulinum]NFL58157.1 NUDIX domain-containing protein [Clostridium botulinum]NFL62650.1 NUDIX domain-containing protein [Clostridium botulinum]
MARKDYYYDKNAPRVNSIIAAASAIVTDKAGRIVMHKRVDNKLWSLVGGAMEYGESISDTIRREIKEETGLEVQIIRIIGVYTNPNHIIEYSDGEVRQQFSICFHCKIISGNIQVSDESLEVRLFSKEELKSVDMHQAQRVRIEDYFANEEIAFIR